MQQDLKGRRIAIVYGGFIKRSGGVVTHIKNLEILLREMGASVTVFSFDNVPPYISYPIVLIERAFNSLAAPLGYRMRFALTRKYWNHCLPRSFDWYFFEDIYSVPDGVEIMANFSTFIHAMRSDQLPRHTCQYEIKYLINLEQAMLNKYQKHIICLSEVYANRLNYKYGVTIGRIVYNFLSISPFATAWENRSNTILFVGNLEARKNPLFLIEVANELVNQRIDFHLKFVGAGELHGSMLNKIKKLNLQNYIGLTDSLTHDQVLRLMSISKLLLLPSLDETLPYALIEAKLSGCVTICNVGLDIPSDLTDYRIGIAESDINDWAKKIQYILSDNFKKVQNDQSLQRYSRESARKSILNILSELGERTY